MNKTLTAFDSIAEGYDIEVSSNSILQWMRGTVHAVYLKYFRPGDRILELNCGTGIDALFLARSGLRVFATDASQKMIEVLKRKIAAQSNLPKGEQPAAGGNVKAEVCPFSDIGRLEENNFDGIVSNFGGLNCINDFRELSRQLSLKLNPNGRLIAVVMNKVCPWEILYFSAKLDQGNAFRRLSQNGLVVRLKQGSVRTFYFSPKQFGNAFRKYFLTERIFSLALFTPPPYLSGFYSRHKLAAGILTRLDEILNGVFPFNRFGDHFIIVMRKKS